MCKLVPAQCLELQFSKGSLCVIGQKASGRSKVKIKVKFNLEEAMKTQKQSTGIALLFL